jgi:hypothetical protein
VDDHNYDCGIMCQPHRNITTVNYLRILRIPLEKFLMGLYSTLLQDFLDFSFMCITEWKHSRMRIYFVSTISILMHNDGFVLS